MSTESDPEIDGHIKLENLTLQAKTQILEHQVESLQRQIVETKARNISSNLDPEYDGRDYGDFESIDDDPSGDDSSYVDEIDDDEVHDAGDSDVDYQLEPSDQIPADPTPDNQVPDNPLYQKHKALPKGKKGKAPQEYKRKAPLPFDEFLRDWTARRPFDALLRGPNRHRWPDFVKIRDDLSTDKISADNAILRFNQWCEEVGIDTNLLTNSLPLMEKLRGKKGVMLLISVCSYFDMPVDCNGDPSKARYATEFAMNCIMKAIGCLGLNLPCFCVCFVIIFFALLY